VSTPIWLLDVDGVINAVSKNPTAWPEYKMEIINGFPIRWSPRVIDFIKSGHEQGTFEVRWLTTWGALANNLLAPVIGLPEFTVVAEMPFRQSWYEAWWKFDAAKIVAEEDRPVIWTDDDLLFDFEAFEWVVDLGFLPVVPDSREGLTNENLRRIEEYAKSYA
jgi:hypothetical protein